MLLKFPAKRLRAEVIKEYVGDKKVVCFSCGNASRELVNAGVDVLEIGRYGVLTPTHWFTIREVAETFKGYFDATPGHLPLDLMQLIADKYKQYLDAHRLIKHDECDIPTGSGETLVCLKLAYPEKKFTAVYNITGLEAETEYNENAPLNNLVKLLAIKIII